MKISTHSISLPSFIVISPEIAKLREGQPLRYFRLAKCQVQIGLRSAGEGTQHAKGVRSMEHLLEKLSTKPDIYVIYQKFNHFLNVNGIVFVISI